MEIAQKIIFIALESIENKEILDLYMAFSGDIGTLLTQLKMQIIQEKELINWHGSLNR